MRVGDVEITIIGELIKGNTNESQERQKGLLESVTELKKSIKD